jgi:hypothetical protein
VLGDRYPTFSSFVYLQIEIITGNLFFKYGLSFEKILIFLLLSLSRLICFAFHRRLIIEGSQPVKKRTQNYLESRRFLHAETKYLFGAVLDAT